MAEWRKRGLILCGMFMDENQRWKEDKLSPKSCTCHNWYGHIKAVVITTTVIKKYHNTRNTNNKKLVVIEEMSDCLTRQFSLSYYTHHTDLCFWCHILNSQFVISSNKTTQTKLKWQNYSISVMTLVFPKVHIWITRAAVQDLCV